MTTSDSMSFHPSITVTEEMSSYSESETIAFLEDFQWMSSSWIV